MSVEEIRAKLVAGEPVTSAELSFLERERRADPELDREIEELLQLDAWLRGTEAADRSSGVRVWQSIETHLVDAPDDDGPSSDQLTTVLMPRVESAPQPEAPTPRSARIEPRTVAFAIGALGLGIGLALLVATLL